MCLYAVLLSHGHRMDIMIHIYKIFSLTSYTFCLSILYVSVRWAKPSLDPWYPLWRSPKSTNTARLETNPFQEHGMGERHLRLLIDFSQMIYHPFMIQFPASITDENDILCDITTFWRAFTKSSGKTRSNSCRSLAMFGLQQESCVVSC